MNMPKSRKTLKFPCECVSAKSGYSDPWAGIAQYGLLPDGTKELILNEVARQPKTIAQLAKELGLSQPSIHAHIDEMTTSELLRESVEMEKRYPTERYYEPNFPVLKAGDRDEFLGICNDLSERVASLFEKRCAQMEKLFAETSVAGRGWEFADVNQYLYAQVQRGARELLEERGLLAPRARHRNGVDWVFWAEEA